MMSSAKVHFFSPELYVGDELEYSTCSVTYANLRNWFGRMRSNESFWLVPGTHHEAGVTFETE